MGNCQAAETAAPTAEIERPDGKRERICQPISACQIMASYPGYYVAALIFSGGEEEAEKYVSLLRPDDTLLAGHVYRLVSYEEVLREFGSTKRVRLSRLVQREEQRSAGANEEQTLPEIEEEWSQRPTAAAAAAAAAASIAYDGGRTESWRLADWKPTLHSISEADI